MPTEDNNGQLPIGHGMFYRSDENGEWKPIIGSGVPEIKGKILFNLTEEDHANIAAIFEPLGELEIVPNPGDSGKNDKSGKDGDGDDS